MAEYSNTALQTVAAGGNILFAESPIPCNRGLVLHREGSGVFLLRGAQPRARYKVTFGGNISVPTGGTVGAVSLALAINGEALPSTIMTVVPAAIGDFFNVSRTTFVDVPCGVGVSVSVENVTTTAAGVAAPVDVINANLVIERVA